MKMIASFSRKVQGNVQTNFAVSKYSRFFSSSNELQKHFDITIVGGGAVGSALANLISESIPSLSVALMDARTPKSPTDAFNIDSLSKTSFPSPRAYALSPKSLSLLGDDIVSKLDEKGRLAYYDTMQVWESDGPAVLQFNHHDIDDTDKLNGDILGAVVEDEPMVSCLWDKMKNNSHIELISPTVIEKISAPSASDDESKVEIMYKNAGNDNAESSNLTTNLLVAADGANSFVRRSLGTFHTISNSYGRTAVTCTVEIDSSIHKTAFQRFQKNGPIALLPVWNEDSSKRQGNCGDKTYANIVWSTTPEEAKYLKSLPEKDFVMAMNDLLQSGPTNAPPLFPTELKNSLPRPFQNAMNGIEMLSQSANTGLTMSGMTERRQGFRVAPMITNVVGRLFSFDLNLMHAKNYISNRICLVGDAAHTIHPMAGQGLNLGMGDAACLTKNIKHVVESGMGIDTNAGLDYALKQYESSRQREVVATMGGIQFLHGAFGTTFSPAVHVRSVGMNMINSIGPVRRKLVKVATGIEDVVSI